MNLSKIDDHNSSITFGQSPTARIQLSGSRGDGEWQPNKSRLSNVHQEPGLTDWL